MPIRVRRNFNFADIKLTPGESAMRRVGKTLRDQTVERTRRGLDEEGKAFAPSAHPDSGQGGQSVDLQGSGEMLRDYDVVAATDHSVGLGFTSERSATIAALHDAGTRNMPARKFVGVPIGWVMAALREAFRKTR